MTTGSASEPDLPTGLEVQAAAPTGESHRSERGCGTGELAGLRRAGSADLAAVTRLQHAAYSRNRELLGVEPLPLLADYAQVLADHEIWLMEETEGLAGVLILQSRTEDLLIWSIAAAPRRQGSGLGNRLLGAAEERARGLGRQVLRLYTGDRLTANVAWYERHGYVQERVEDLSDRRLVHMVKRID